MKITLIYPGFKKDPSGLQEPLGILYIASALRKAGHEVSFIDLTFDEGTDLLKKAALSSDLVGMSSTSILFGNAKKALKEIKKAKNVPCFLGGSHGTLSPQDALKAGFDYAIIGEGEDTAVKLADSIKKRKPIGNVDGIAFKDKGRINVNPKKYFITNLDTLPFPARDLWNYRKYFDTGTTEIGIIATRGCPYNCLYCKPMVDKLFGNRTRKRTAKNVVKEIGQIVKNYSHLFEGNVKLWFKDDTLTYGDSVKWFKEFNNELKKRKLKIEFGCHTRVDNINYELLKIMKEAGLTHISFGIESGSQKILNYYRKGTTVEQAIKAFNACNKLGLSTFAYIMVGAPIETRKDLELTYKLIKKIKPGGVEVYTTMPYPGNDLYTELKKKDLIKKEYNLNYWAKQSPIKMRYLSDKDLSEYRRKIYRLNNKQLMLRYFTSFGNLRKLMKYVINRPGFVINYLKRSL